MQIDKQELDNYITRSDDQYVTTSALDDFEAEIYRAEDELAGPRAKRLAEFGKWVHEHSYHFFNEGESREFKCKVDKGKLQVTLTVKWPWEATSKLPLTYREIDSEGLVIWSIAVWPDGDIVFWYTDIGYVPVLLIHTEEFKEAINDLKESYEKRMAILTVKLSKVENIIMRMPRMGR